MIGPLWTVSNVLSFIRVLLVIPIAMLLWDDAETSRYYALALIVVAIATDYFDGLIARYFKQVTDVGKIVDPIADKVAVGTVGIILALQQKLPLWFLGIVVGRDLLIFLGGLYISNTRRIILQSTLVGKLAVTALAALIFVVVLDTPALFLLEEGLLFASVALLMASFVIYLKRFMDVLSTERGTEAV